MSLESEGIDSYYWPPTDVEKEALWDAKRAFAQTLFKRVPGMIRGFESYVAVEDAADYLSTNIRRLINKEDPIAIDAIISVERDMHEGQSFPIPGGELKSKTVDTIRIDDATLLKTLEAMQADDEESLSNIARNNFINGTMSRVYRYVRFRLEEQGWWDDIEKRELEMRDLYEQWIGITTKPAS